MCSIYGWTVEYCLQMPAVRFYSMLKNGRSNRYRLNASLMADLCGVAAISWGDADYQIKLQNMYYYRSIGKDPPKDKTDRVLDADDPKTGELLTKMFQYAGG